MFLLLLLVGVTTLILALEYVTFDWGQLMPAQCEKTPPTFWPVNVSTIWVSQRPGWPRQKPEQIWRKRFLKPSPPSRYLKQRERGGEKKLSLFVSSSLKFASISLPSKASLSLYLVNVSVVSHSSICSINMAHLVQLLLSSVRFETYCPTWPHPLMIWYWWGTSFFIKILRHRILDSSLILWSLFDLDLHVNFPTYIHSHALDLMIFSTGCGVLSVSTSNMISDQFYVAANLNIRANYSRAAPKTIKYRK